MFQNGTLLYGGISVFTYSYKCFEVCFSLFQGEVPDFIVTVEARTRYDAVLIATRKIVSFPAYIRDYVCHVNYVKEVKK